ncbi:hypothetical protein [Azospirillum sp. sgz301742]
MAFIVAGPFASSGWEAGAGVVRQFQPHDTRLGGRIGRDCRERRDTAASGGLWGMSGAAV